MLCLFLKWAATSFNDWTCAEHNSQFIWKYSAILPSISNSSTSVLSSNRSVDSVTFTSLKSTSLTKEEVSYHSCYKHCRWNLYLQSSYYTSRYFPSDRRHYHFHQHHQLLNLMALIATQVSYCLTPLSRSYLGKVCLDEPLGQIHRIGGTISFFANNLYKFAWDNCSFCLIADTQNKFVKRSLRTPKTIFTENQKCLERISAISNARPRLPKIFMILVVVFMHKMQSCIIFGLLHWLVWLILLMYTSMTIFLKCQ